MPAPDIQELALSMRKEGKPYKRPPIKKRKFDKAEDGSLHGIAGKDMQEQETGSRPSSPVQASSLAQNLTKAVKPCSFPVAETISE